MCHFLIPCFAFVFRIIFPTVTLGWGFLEQLMWEFNWFQLEHDQKLLRMQPTVMWGWQSQEWVIQVPLLVHFGIRTPRVPREPPAKGHFSFFSCVWSPPLPDSTSTGNGSRFWHDDRKSKFPLSPCEHDKMVHESGSADPSRVSLLTDDINAEPGASSRDSIPMVIVKP